MRSDSLMRELQGLPEPVKPNDLNDLRRSLEVGFGAASVVASAVALATEALVIMPVAKVLSMVACAFGRRTRKAPQA